MVSSIPVDFPSSNTDSSTGVELSFDYPPDVTFRPINSSPFSAFGGTSAAFPIFSVLPSSAAWTHINLNYGAAGCPLDPPASIPPNDSCAGSLEVTESLTLTTSSSRIEEKDRAGMVFSGVG